MHLTSAKRFIAVFENAVTLACFNVDLYFKLVEKITAFEGEQLRVALLDGKVVEVAI